MTTAALEAVAVAGQCDSPCLLLLAAPVDASGTWGRWHGRCIAWRADVGSLADAQA